MLNFETLDIDLDKAIDVAKGEEGTLYIQTNSPQGRCVVRTHYHHKIAIALRDWLNKNYVDK